VANTLATLADDTGGRSFFDIGDFGRVFQSVQSDNAGYYLVGYYSTDAPYDGSWRRVRVKSNVSLASALGLIGTNVSPRHILPGELFPYRDGHIRKHKR